MLGDGRRSADVVAVTDVCLYAMFGTRFREMQEVMPAVAARLQALAESRPDAKT
jgi:CRP-like cAMP-binding protein